MRAQHTIELTALDHRARIDQAHEHRLPAARPTAPKSDRWPAGISRSTSARRRETQSDLGHPIIEQVGPVRRAHHPSTNGTGSVSEANGDVHYPGHGAIPGGGDELTRGLTVRTGVSEELASSDVVAVPLNRLTEQNVVTRRRHRPRAGGGGEGSGCDLVCDATEPRSLPPQRPTSRLAPRGQENPTGGLVAYGSSRLAISSAVSSISRAATAPSMWCSLVAPTIGAVTIGFESTQARAI